ncbi:hypothetical protein L1049_027774 [Liquidambar formosana]|uniref:Uncharacterized protein n=1 Tax=Liquidambar formosana TaxID=63359 RepID=A0AAP0WVS3_LIQFO
MISSDLRDRYRCLHRRTVEREVTGFVDRELNETQSLIKRSRLDLGGLNSRSNDLIASWVRNYEKSNHLGGLNSRSNDLIASWLRQGKATNGNAKAKPSQGSERRGQATAKPRQRTGWPGNGQAKAV